VSIRVVEARAVREVAHVLDRARRQIVEDVHAMTGREQGFSEMRADEPGAACDQKSHAASVRLEPVRVDPAVAIRLSKNLVHDRSTWSQRPHDRRDPRRPPPAAHRVEVISWRVL